MGRNMRKSREDMPSLAMGQKHGVNQERRKNIHLETCTQILTASGACCGLVWFS